MLCVGSSSSCSVRLARIPRFIQYRSMGHRDIFHHFCGEKFAMWRVGFACDISADAILHLMLRFVLRGHGDLQAKWVCSHQNQELLLLSQPK